MKTKYFIIFIVAVIVIVGGLGFFLNKSSSSNPSKLDGFAQCLKQSGAEFYGAFWCPHCQEQKALFGSSKQYLPYIECSNPDNTQVQICKDKKIESYPTWIFKDGTRQTGKMELSDLVAKTSCVLPQ